MFRSRLFWRLYGSFVAVVAVFAAIVGFAVSGWLTEESLQGIRSALRAKAALLGEVAKAALQGGRDPTLQERIQRLGGGVGARLTVINAEGVVLADSEEDPGRMNNHASRPEIRMAAAQGEGFSTRFSNTVERHMMYVALAVPAGSGPPGFARASIALDLVDQRVSRVRGYVLLGAGIAALVALLLGLFFARWITSRVESITDAAAAMAGGDYSRRVFTNSRDEIGRLAVAFNSMAEQMQARIDRITEDRNTVQAILRSMVEGVIAVDRNEQVLHMNAVAGSILGVDPERVIGTRIWETVRVNEIARALGSVLAGEHPAAGGRVAERVLHTQSRIMRGDEECLLEIGASPLTDADGEVTGAVVVFHDVTEMRRLELVRREFVVNASHELKTPITAIRGFIDSLVDDVDMPVETRVKFLQRASSQAERLALLITDLLRLSRVESGEATEPGERLDLRRVAARSVEEFRGVAAGKSIELSAAVGDEPITVEVDPATLALVVDNLVDNAIKYTGTGGHVVVRAAVRDGAALVEVEDDGVGIDPAHQDRIFERFYRVDKARSREMGGTGLGLSIAKHACGLLGGELSLTSEPGVGSVFRVRLPLAGA